MEGNKPRFMRCQWTILLLGGILMITDQCTGYRMPTGRAEQLGKLSRYDIVTPYRLAGRERRDARTITQDGHLQETTFVLPAFGKELMLDVRLNENLFPRRYVERSYGEDGEAITRKPHTHHHCYYHGTVRGVNKSSVAISTCNGVSGVLSVDEESFFVEPLLESADKHLVYRPEDRLDKKTWAHGIDTSHIEGSSQGAAQEESSSDGSRSRRDVLSETKFVELVIVNDYQEFIYMNENLTKVQERSKEMANIMDMIYRPMNVRIALVGVVVWNTGDAFDVSSKPGTSMAEFQRWRKNTLLLDIKNDNAQFLTAVAFEGSTVGMASLGTMCSDERSGGVNQDHDSNVAVVASTMAHEMGHNLGFIHDTSDRNCRCDAPSNIGCVMEPSSGPIPPTNFSTCSYDDLETSLTKGLGACLFDYPDHIFDGPICGNGFLEENEECDCGTPEECDNDCCIAETCHLHENATCAVGECCENCQQKKAGDLCRDIGNECDLPEYCTGLSAECPANVYRQNGEKCADVLDATCYDGQCLTYDAQCLSVWGPGAKVAHEACFSFNTQGSAFGNCGGTSSSYQACTNQNVKCGKLMCEGGADYPILSSLAKASKGYIWDDQKNQHICKTASIDLGQDIPDPGYVAMGSPCAPGFVCSDFRCQNLSALNIKACPQNCNGRGVCNSKNHCHCDVGWNPPLCDIAGNGGSIDSGPARLPAGSGPNTSTVVVLLVMFLLILPALTLIGILVYCKRQTLSKMLSKGTTKQSYSSRPSQSKDTRGVAGTPVRAAPVRPAPTIQHTHLREPEPTVFKFPPARQVPPAKSVARPAPSAPASKSQEKPQVHWPPPKPPQNKPSQPKPSENKPSLSSKPVARSASSAAPKAVVPPQRPTRPTAVPPRPLSKPPSPVKSAATPPVVPPVAFKAPPKPSSNSSQKPQFRLPPPGEAGVNKQAPERPAKPALKPPLAGNKPPPKPMVRPKPNVNRNNSTELDNNSTFRASREVSNTDQTIAPPQESGKLDAVKPAVALKPVPRQKPQTRPKPTVPTRPASLNSTVKQHPEV